MKRRDFLLSSALASLGLSAGKLSALPTEPRPTAPRPVGPRATRKILIAGGGFGTAFIRYLATLTGKDRPRLCYLPTAAADSDSSVLGWYERCAPLDVVPFAQPCYISSYDMDRSFEEVLLSMDGIVASGGNTLNQQAIWKAQGIDRILREAWDRGIVLGGASAGSLCWFEEGTTDSRPKELTKVECLGFLKGSHSPHYDAEGARRPTYQRMILSGELKPGYACDNNAGIYFEDNEVKRIVATREDARVRYVSVMDGEVVELLLPTDEIIG